MPVPTTKAELFKTFSFFKKSEKFITNSDTLKIKIQKNFITLYPHPHLLSVFHQKFSRQKIRPIKFNFDYYFFK